MPAELEENEAPSFSPAGQTGTPATFGFGPECLRTSPPGWPEFGVSKSRFSEATEPRLAFRLGFGGGPAASARTHTHAHTHKAAL